MKYFRYALLQSIKENGEAITLQVTSTYSPDMEDFIKSQAYNGEYTIEDDGQPETIPEPTQLDRIEAQVAYTAMMTDTMLEV